MKASFRSKSKFWQLAVVAACALPFALVSNTGMSTEADDTGPPSWEFWQHGSEWRKGWRHENMTPKHRHRMQRHWIFMNGNIPAKYQGAHNSLAESDDNITRGQALYTEHCARCHGTEGLGDGEAGNDLYPSPALLAFIVQAPIAADSYLMWTISEGGSDFNSDMPAFKDTLDDTERWQVITYIRNGFALP